MAISSSDFVKTIKTLDRVAIIDSESVRSISDEGWEKKRFEVLDNLLQTVSQTACRASFARLYQQSSTRLLGIITRITRDRGAAEDVLQETYVNAWCRRGQYDRQKGHAIYWLSEIARNEAISSLRYRKARPLTVTNSADGPELYERLPCPQSGPEQLLMQAECKQAVFKSLDSLSFYERQSFALAFFDGLSHAEIASHLGRPLGSVKSWLRRSLAVMRPSLAEHR